MIEQNDTTTPLQFVNNNYLPEKDMRLFTRADFDGVASAAFICDMEEIDQILFAHPKDMQDGLVEVKEGDPISNLPFHPNAALWFDHHDKTEDLPDPMPNIRGKCGVAPSAARLIYDYYNSNKLKKYEEMLVDVDKVDSATLDIEDVLDPQGWVLLSYTIDPRTAMGGFREYSLFLIETIREGKTIEEILSLPSVQGRLERFVIDESAYKKALLDFSKLDDNVIVTDFRSLDKIPTGNRFLPFPLFLKGNVQVRIHWKYTKDKIIVAVGKSIFTRTCDTHVGNLMAKYDGGGLAGAGSCALDIENAEAQIAEIIEALK